MKRWDSMPWFFWMLSFKPAFSCSSCTFIKRLFNSSLLSAIRVISSAYLRLSIFLPAILIPASSFIQPSILPWCTLYLSWISRVAIYTLDDSYPNLEPVRCSMSSSNCCFLTCIQISQFIIWQENFSFFHFPSLSACCMSGPRAYMGLWTFNFPWKLEDRTLKNLRRVTLSLLFFVLQVLWVKEQFSLAAFS